jgi:hypothetical protein
VSKPALLSHALRINHALRISQDALHCTAHHVRHY